MPFIAPLIGAAITGYGAFAGVAAFIGAIAPTLITAGIGIAASYLLSSLLPKPASTDQTVPSGVKFQREYGANVSRQVACGLIGMAGHDVYVNTYNTANGSLQQIYVISDYYTTALTRVAIGGVWQTLGAIAEDGFAPITSGDFANLIFVKFVNGKQTSADAKLVAYANPSDRWSSNDIGVGISHVIIAMEYNQEKNSSFPDFFFEFQGAPFYDPRKDSTAGGSGSHRWADKTTHEYTENPIVIEYNYRRGISIGSDVFCGMDMQPSDLPLEKWFTAMNICDEYVNGAPRYRVSIILDCMTTHINNLQSLAISCGSMQIDAVNGSWPIVGTDQPSVATFTDDDLIALADLEYTAKRSMSELINSVSGNFPYPDQLWSMIGYEPQIATEYLSIDRRTRDVNIDYPMVPYYDQVARLAWIALYENRYEVTANVTLRPRFQVLEAGDWVDWNSARYGLRTYIVTGTQLSALESNGPRNVTLSLQERDGQIYVGTTPPPIILPFPPGEPQYLSEVESFDIVAVSVVGDSGRAQAAIRASWLSITDVTVTGVQLIYYPVDSPTTVLTKTVPRDNNIVVLVEGVVGNTEYEVRARLITDPARTTAYNAGDTVVTLDIVIDLGAAINYQVTTLLNRLNDKQAEIEALISSVASNQNGRNWLDKQQSIKQLQSINGTLSASITEVMTVAVDTQVAFAEYQVIVDAQIDDVSASVTTNATAIATVDGKLAASWSMTLNVDGHISGIKQISDGTVSTFTISADAFFLAFPAAGAGGTPRTVFTIQNVNGSAQMALRGDFYADGVIKSVAIAAGEVKTVNLDAQAVTAAKIQAGSITSASGVIGALSVNSLSIGDNAITIPQYQFLTSVVSIPIGPITVLSFTVSIDTTGLAGKSINLIASTSVTIQSLVGSGGQNTAQIYINGSMVSENGVNIPNAVVGTVSSVGGYTFTASGGVQNIPVRVDVVGMQTSLLSQRILTVIAAKR